jgi:2-polyprenyl-6-methoxyphenol hydroxylase-like FAD-dependent oxidoreductase
MKILVSGASIAGLSTAYWLVRSGHDVTVVENSADPRRGGVAVDVRGEALEVAREMGVLDEVTRNRVPTEDIYYFLDAAGRVEAQFTPSTQFYDSPGDIEISRDSLSDILRAAVPPGARFRYGESVAAVRELADGVEVRLTDGTTQRVDLLVGADGMHSNVRRLVFGSEQRFVRHLGLYVGIVKRSAAGAGLAGSHVYNIPGRMVMLRGDGVDCSAVLGFRSAWLDYDFRDVAAQQEIVTDAFRAEPGWRVPEVVDEIGRDAHFYFDSVGQVRMDGWSEGRTVLVGDAGYCASFFSGMGTSLAMIGAASLARELAAAGDDLSVALPGYDRAMRPVVDEAHEMANGGADILFPVTAEDIEERNARLREAARA